MPRLPDRILSVGATLLAVVLLVVFSARTFRGQHEVETLYPSPALTRVFPLSEINPHLAGTSGDTPVYEYEGTGRGGSLLVIGGTHASEIAGIMTLVLLVETLQVDAGRVFLIPHANASAITHDEPQEAHPQHVVFETAGGPRAFRFGARFTNPVHQWPDPEVYVQPMSGTVLAGSETRNLNRAYPGIADGNLTERIAWAITELIRREDIDLAFDLHESSPEYPVINAIVASEASQDVASYATISLQVDGWEFSLEPSPPNFHGLSHREWTDHTDTRPILLETANPAMGRLRGRTNADLAVIGKDERYVQASRIGVLNVPFDEAGIPIERRIARDLAAIAAIVDAFNTIEPDRAIAIGGWPTSTQLLENGLGAYLAPAPAGPVTADATHRPITVAVTDSGLGGLSVVAEIERRLRGTDCDVQLVFFNALFDAESGYNSLGSRTDKIRLFDRALQGLLEDCHPDLVLIACNTLSVLYPDTDFAARGTTSALDIVRGGVDLITAHLPASGPGTVILFGTETTIGEGTYQAALVARGLRPDRIVAQACPQLASYIETGFDNEGTAFLVDAYVGEATATAVTLEQPLFVSLNCTHYGYALAAWQGAFAARDIVVAGFLDPNLTLASAALDSLAVMSPRDRAPQDHVTVRVVSMAEIAPAAVESISRSLQDVSAATATALRAHERRPDLFAWRDLLPIGEVR